jgi:alanine racemase
MPARLTINLTNLKHNIDEFKKKLLNNQELLVMVKADAYGAGIIKVARELEDYGINHFGVAYLKEAINLRNNGVKGNITVFSGLVPDEYTSACDVDAIYSVSDLESLICLDKEAKNKKKGAGFGLDLQGQPQPHSPVHRPRRPAPYRRTRRIYRSFRHCQGSTGGNRAV